MISRRAFCVLLAVEAELRSTFALHGRSVPRLSRGLLLGRNRR